jgi:RNA polymerase sigma factor (sigma-70 family)
LPLPEEKYKFATDLELLNIYKSNADNAIVGILYKRHLLMCLGVAMKYLNDQEKAKDAVMNVFEKLLSSLSNHTIDNFKSWLFTVVKNNCLMQLRKEKPNEHVNIDAEKNIYNSMEKENFLHQTAEDLAENKIQELEKAIGMLNDEQRICIDLFYLKDKSYAEVSQISGYDLNKVKSNIQNGKRNLKLKLQGYDKK